MTPGSVLPVDEVFGGTRYVGLEKTHLQHVLTAVVMNFVRIGHWLEGHPLAKTRPSAFARLCRSEAA